MILGVDVSTYLEVCEHGAVFLERDRQIDPLDAFRANGVDHMRIRVWNDPVSPEGKPYLAGNCDINNYIRLGTLAKEKGYSLLMDLHYSDFWADPGKQFPPKAWASFDADELAAAVYAFTRSCLESVCAAGVSPAMIQVGNEITNGMLWPIGKLERIEGVRTNYDVFCKLLAAGCRACREITPEAKIILHLERSNDKQVYREFFSEMQNAGIDYDIIGASYYPYWHGTPQELFENLDQCRCFGKELMIMELAYGFTVEPYLLNGAACRLVIDRERADIPGITDIYPITPAGQASFIGDFLSSAKLHGISGVFYWEPLWLPGDGICWASEAGQAYIHEEGKSTANEWANQCLFDYEGRELPAFDAFA